jgi:anaerobic magnesium-protoporphyrin IX monomethyl ester cyclase
MHNKKANIIKYRHVLCVYPYYKEPTFLDFFPPAGIEHIAAALEGSVGGITLVDLRQEKEFYPLSKLIQYIRQQIDLICVSVNWPFYFDQVCNLINALPADIPLIAGGRQATERAEELFERCPHINIIVRGEGDQTIREIAQGKDRETILGISYRKNGQIVQTPDRPLPPIESIRYPNRRLRRASYHIQPKGIKLVNAEFDTIFSSRGCPHHCKFCTFTTNSLGQRWPYSPRTPESVVREIKELHAGVIYFEDEDFFLDQQRTEQICDLLIAEGIKKTFIAMSRIDLAHAPARLFKKLQRVGFKAILLGLESPHNKILRQFEKGFTTQDIRQAFQVLHTYPFYFHGLFIYGNIGESREEMLSIAPFAREIGVDSIYVQPLQQRNFSALKELLEQTPDYSLSPEGFVLSEISHSVEDLKHIGKEINKRFYTPRQLYRMLRKLSAIRVITPATPVMFLRLLLRLPGFLAGIVTKRFKKGRGGRKRGIPYG